MFEEDTFDQLAELYINLNDCPLEEYLYCLCSRSILRTEDFQESKGLTDTVDSGSKDENNSIRFLNSSTESQPSTVQAFKKKDQDEGVSCYCSASHCSTDDSTREALHSDSGADVSEAAREPGWDDYWAKHGESIIWESWIERYGEYVDPVYSRESKSTTTGAIENLPEVSHENSDVTRLSFGSEISDSFTNVTPLTLSELSTEDSSFLSSSDSAGSVSADVAQWQALWIDHFNSQYQLAYENYKSGLKKQAELDQEIDELSVDEESVDNNISNNFLCEFKSDNINKNSDLTEQKLTKKRLLEINSVGQILSHLKSINMAKEESSILEINPSVGYSDLPEERSSKIVSSGDEVENNVNNEPHSETKNNSEHSDCDTESKAATDARAKLKRPHEREDDRLRGAFNLIGLSYHGEGVSSGSVHYKKRNIRWQNRMLNMKVHIHFDEEGQIITKDTKTDKVEQNASDEKWQLADSSEVKSDFSEKDDSSDGEFYSASEESDRERRKKKKKRKGLPKEILQNERLLKFWYRRYRLFSKFDEGIKLDEESWYSVTPEKISQHIAERCRCDVIIDACCGAGGNTIQFAFTCERVIAIDIDPHKIELARHNAKVYGVEDRIEFIVGDFIKLAPYLHADVVFLSPPWGGLDYFNQPSYHLDNILPPLGGSGLFEISSKITPNVAMYLPKNVNVDELMMLTGPGGSLEVEQNFLEKKLIAVTSYFGELIGACSSQEKND